MKMEKSSREVDAVLDAIASALGFKVESEKGWLFLKNCREDGFADESRHIEFGEFHGIYSSRHGLLKGFLDSKYLHVPTTYIDYGCRVHDVEKTANPFYRMDMWQAAVEAELMADVKRSK